MKWIKKLHASSINIFFSEKFNKLEFHFFRHRLNTLLMHILHRLINSIEGSGLIVQRYIPLSFSKFFKTVHVHMLDRLQILCEFCTNYKKYQYFFNRSIVCKKFPCIECRNIGIFLFDSVIIFNTNVINAL